MIKKHIICPCCGKESNVDIPDKCNDISLNYSELINDTEYFFELVDLCPECGYAMLFDNNATSESKEFIKSDYYKSILNTTDLEEGLKRWILLALICEIDEDYTHAAISYLKAFDYVEIRKIADDKRFIEKAASLFLAAAEENASFVDSFLAVDCLRRDGDFEKALVLIEAIEKTYEGELVEKLLDKEKVLMDIGVMGKRIIDM